MQSYADFLPPSSRCVVEFGCGDGTTGREFRKIQPDCRYVGIDRDAAVLRKAAEVLSQTLQAGPAETELERNGIYAPDCLLYQAGYLDAPELTGKLSAQVSLLPEQGQVIFVLDHPGYFRNLLAIAAGQPALARNRRSLPELLELAAQCGLQVADVQAVQVREDERLTQDAALQQLAASLGACSGRPVGQQLWTRQYVVRAVKQSVRFRPLLLQALLGEARITARLRILEPQAFAATLPGVKVHAEPLTANLKLGIPYAEKIMLFQRSPFASFAEGRENLQKLVDKGYLAVAEQDDDPRIWKERYERTHYLEYAGVHAVQVSTPALADFMSQFNPEVRVFRNELRYLPERRDYRLREDAPVTLFFGALNRTADWKAVLPELNKVLQKYGSRVQVKVLFDRVFFEALRTEHKVYLGNEYPPDGFVPYPRYMEELHGADIALLPLLDTPMNRMKSDLKFIESAGCGAVALASPTVYADTLRDGRTGFLYRDGREFRERLELLIEDRARRIETAEAAYCYVKQNRLLAQHYMERMDWYRELIARQPELEAKRQQRIGLLVK